MSLRPVARRGSLVVTIESPRLDALDWTLPDGAPQLRVAVRDATGAVPFRRSGDSSWLRIRPTRALAAPLVVRVEAAPGPAPPCPFEVSPATALFCGEAVLPVPTDGEAVRPVRLELLPDGDFYRTAASSFGLSASLESDLSFAHLRKACFLFGDVHEARFVAPEGRDHAAWAGYFAFDPRWVAAEAAGVRTMVDRWLGIRRPADDPSVGLLFATTADAPPRARLLPFFRGALIQAGPSAIWSPRERLDLARLFVQRTIGATLSLTDAGARWWFDEGVAHAVGLRILADGGILTLEEAAGEINSWLVAEALSHWAGAPLQELTRAAGGATEDRDAARQLLAMRGALVGIALDGASALGLQQTLRRMLSRTVTDGDDLPSADDFFRTAAGATEAEDSSLLRRAFEQGQTIPLRAADLSPCLRLVKRRCYRFRLGFEQRSSEAGEAFVARLDEGGPAARAGLRVGDRILRFDYVDEAADLPVSIDVRRDDETIHLRYLPRGRSRPGRAVVMASRTGACRPRS